MELRLFLSAVARGWAFLLVALVLGVFAAGAHAATVNPSYSSTTQLYVEVKSAQTINDLSTANGLAQQIAVNDAALATTPYVLRSAAAKMGDGTTVSDLQGAIAVSVTTNTAFLSVTATANSAKQAQKIAQAVSVSLIAASPGVSTGDTKTNSKTTLELTLVQPANLPLLPTTGSLVSELPIGAVAGLIVAIAVVLLRERFNGRFQSMARIAVVTDADVLGSLPNDSRASRVRALDLHAKSPVRYEAFRSLRTAIQGLGVLTERGAVIAVTSSVPNEGKSSTVVGLAVSLAAAGRDVVVVEADLRRPQITPSFRVAPRPGLAEVLTRTQSLRACLQPTADPRIAILAAGSAGAAAGELLESDAMGDVLAQLSSNGTVVLVDTPPLLALSDAASLARRADHVLLVVGAQIAREREVVRAVAVLRQMQVHVAGVVVNRVPKLWADGGTRAYAAYTSRRR